MGTSRRIEQLSGHPQAGRKAALPSRARLARRTIKNLMIAVPVLGALRACGSGHVGAAAGEQAAFAAAQVLVSQAQAVRPRPADLYMLASARDLQHASAGALHLRELGLSRVRVVTQ